MEKGKENLRNMMMMSSGRSGGHNRALLNLNANNKMGGIGGGDGGSSNHMGGKKSATLSSSRPSYLVLPGTLNTQHLESHTNVNRAQFLHPNHQYVPSPCATNSGHYFYLFIIYLC